MVFFTCNNCGDSIKKPAVEKHYNTKCRGRKNVSCMDCNKDFYGEEYVAHTKCITEIEKYSGKDYVHKVPTNSNAKKQETWMDIVHSILETKEYKLDAQTRAAFERLQTMDNVPRKKVKFINYTNNCLRMYKMVSEKVWNVLEQELEKMKQAKAAEAEQKKLQAQAAKEPKEEEKPAAETVTTNGENAEDAVSKKKKKKSKKSKTEDAENSEEPPAKKSKLNGDTAGDEAEEQRDEPATKKKKSKKSKKSEEDENESTEPPAKKSKVNGITTSEASEETNEPKTKKKKSKKSTNDVDATDETAVPVASTTNGTNGTNGIIETEEDLDWSSSLERIVAKHAEGITTEKLKKKILKKYLAKLALEELSDKQQKKFEKKFTKILNKSPAIQLDGEIVKPC